MSLTSYRAAPPRDPEVQEQDAVDWRGRKFFLEKFDERFSFIHIVVPDLPKYSLARRNARSYFSMLLGCTHSSIG
jgi:hypothetical protein